MVKKSFKQKEEAFLAKKNSSTEPLVLTSYVPVKSNRDEALEQLQKQGYNVSIKDNVLYCECRSKEEYNNYQRYLLEKFGKNNKVPFSYGASIGRGAKG